MDLGISNWRALSEWAKSLKRPSILEANVDFEKDPGDALAKLSVGMVVMRDDCVRIYANTLTDTHDLDIHEISLHARTIAFLQTTSPSLSDASSRSLSNSSARRSASS